MNAIFFYFANCSAYSTETFRLNFTSDLLILKIFLRSDEAKNAIISTIIDCLVVPNGQIVESLVTINVKDEILGYVVD